MFNYSKLKGKIKEVYSSQKNFAKAMKMSERTLSVKLNGSAMFTQVEMLGAVELLGINIVDLHEYFFVAKTQTIE